MRLSLHLCKQHIGWNFKKVWLAQSARKIPNTGVDKRLLERGIPIVNSQEFLDKYKEEKLHIVGIKAKPIAFDKTHPNWHDRVLLTYRDNNVLLEGLAQAKILTNTVEVKQGLPESLILKSSKNFDQRVKEIILTSHVFDAQQVKLPKRKDPERPAWNFPRDYGITQSRKIKLLLRNLLQLIENSNDSELVKQRHISEDSHFAINFERENDLIQFELTGDLLTSINPLNNVSNESTDDLALPNIFPIEPTITLTEENIYEVRRIYPINLKFAKSHPHTIFVSQIEEEIKNLYEEPVTDAQIFGRSLLKTFTVAASYAKEKYGNDVGILPKPVTVQCVHTNGHLFHFGILQLNTLNLLDANVKNLWFQTDRIPLFETCCYNVGKPVLQGYNTEVIQHLNAFYNNI